MMPDLARRIEGDFQSVEQRAEKIVPAARTCRFAGTAPGRTAPCLAVAGVLETIAAENLGSCKALVERTIAQGAAERRLTFRWKAYSA